MNRINPFITVLIILTISSCDKDSGPYIIKSGAPQATVSFSSDIQPIFNNSCIKCHHENHSKGLNLKVCCSWNLLTSGYVDTMNPANSILYKRVVGTLTPQMPLDGPPYLTQGEMDNILQWIKEGAKNN